MTQGRRRVRTALGASATAFVLMEVLRVWLPSMTTPARTGWFGLETAVATGSVLTVVVVAVRLSPPPRVVWTVAIPVAAAARLVLPLVDGVWLLAVATVGVAAGAASLVALAGATAGAAGRSARLGVLAGTAAATAVHAATWTAGLVWPRTPGTLALTVVVAVVLLGTGLGARPGLRDAASDPTATRHAAPWLLLTAVLLLPVAVTGAPGRVAMAGDLGPLGAAGGTVAIQGLGLIAAAAAPRLGTVRAALGGAMLLLVGTAGAAPTAGWPSLAALAAAAVGLGLAFGTGAGPRPHTDHTHRRAAGLGVAGFLALTVTAAELSDASVTGADHLVPLAAAVIATLAAIATCRPAGRGEPPRPVGGAVGFAVAGWLVVSLATVAVAASPPRMPDALPPDEAGVWLPVALLPRDVPSDVPPDDADPHEPPGTADGRSPAVLPGLAMDTLRVATYGVTAGFGLDRRFGPPRQARVLDRMDPDVVVLTGVDRGSLLTGGHDVAGLLAAELDFGPPWFAPSGGARGNLLLTQHRVVEFASRTLPRRPWELRSSEFGAVLQLPSRQVAVLGTELTAASGAARLPQARAVAASVAQLRDRDLPTLVIGELNAPPDAPEIATFDSFLRDPMGPSLATSPADRPAHRLHYVLLSDELRGGVVQRPRSPAAGHLPIALQVTFARAPG